MEKHILAVNKLRMNLYIGCDPRERAFRQPIDIDITFILSKLPRGCFTDQLSDVICYRDLILLLQKQCYDKEFNLIEHLAYTMASIIKDHIKEKTAQLASLEVKVTKIQPPVENVLEGVSFTCTIPA